MAQRNESLYEIIDTTTDKTFKLEVPSNYSLSSSQSIIINESATGNSANTYNNGRLQESIPVNGVLFADNMTDLKNKISRLRAIKDSGVVIEFIMPIKDNNRSNKFFISEISFDIAQYKDSANFQMTLQEFREANVKKVSVNLVGFESADKMRELYNQRTGNI